MKLKVINGTENIVHFDSVQEDYDAPNAFIEAIKERIVEKIEILFVEGTKSKQVDDLSGLEPDCIDTLIVHLQ